jgi:dsDNA-specific endonuclease/ATPase MutS2
MTLDKIRTHLEDADSSLTDAISAAMEQSSALAPIVQEVVTKAANGVYLVPRQRTLLCRRHRKDCEGA